MDQVILYDKTFQQRLQEYKDVLSGSETLPASQIQKGWSFYMELACDPNGWQAIWKIPRLTCESLRIQFPTIVLVYVENTNFTELNAVIRILAVQDDIHLPDKHFVPLIHLWPTKDQDATIGLNLDSTANALDMFRFFHNYIFMPWDIEEDDSIDWLSKHLESRLHLYYDMKNGVIPRTTAEHLRALLTEAKRLQARRELIESEISDTESVDYDSNLPVNNKIQGLMDLHVRMIQIKSEVELLEDPLLRNILLKREREATKSENNLSRYWLVFEQGKIDDYIEFLNKVKPDLPNHDVTFASNLASLLEIVNVNSTIVLNKSRHTIKTMGGLQAGGTLQGLYNNSETLLATTNEDVMLDCCGDVTLKNMTVDAGFAQCGILVRSGTVTFINCKILGNGESSIRQGIIVLSGSKLELIDCEITNFCTAIVGNSGSHIRLENCNIKDVNVGIKFYDLCSLKLKNTCFQDCTVCGIAVETENKLEYNREGIFSDLKVIPDVEIDNVTGKNNKKADILINCKSKIIPVRDLFSNSELDYTIMCRATASEEEEMEACGNSSGEMNGTVIEVEDKL